MIIILQMYTYTMKYVSNSRELLQSSHKQAICKTKIIFTSFVTIETTCHIEIHNRLYYMM